MVAKSAKFKDSPPDGGKQRRPSGTSECPGGGRAGDDPRAAVLLVVARIPSGRVATYGQVASLAGLSGRARWVGRVLSTLPPGTTLPWHRVVNARGRLSLPADCPAGRLQLARLQEEGVLLSPQGIDLTRHGWQPTAH